MIDVVSSDLDALASGGGCRRLVPNRQFFVSDFFPVIFPNYAPIKIAPIKPQNIGRRFGCSAQLQSFYLMSIENTDGHGSGTEFRTHV